MELPNQYISKSIRKDPAPQAFFQDSLVLVSRQRPPSGQTQSEWVTLSNTRSLSISSVKLMGCAQVPKCFRTLAPMRVRFPTALAFDCRQLQCCRISRNSSRMFTVPDTAPTLLVSGIRIAAISILRSVGNGQEGRLDTSGQLPHLRSTQTMFLKCPL